MKKREPIRINAISEPLLTTRQLARELQVTTRTIQNLVSRGIIPKIQIGRCVRFRMSNVLANLENEK